MIHTRILNDVDDRIGQRLNENASSPPPRHDLLVLANMADLSLAIDGVKDPVTRSRLVDLAAAAIEHVATIDRANS